MSNKRYGVSWAYNRDRMDIYNYNFINLSSNMENSLIMDMSDTLYAMINDIMGIEETIINIIREDVIPFYIKDIMYMEENDCFISIDEIDVREAFGQKSEDRKTRISIQLYSSDEKPIIKLDIRRHYGENGLSKAFSVKISSPEGRLASLYFNEFYVLNITLFLHVDRNALNLTRSIFSHLFNYEWIEPLANICDSFNDDKNILYNTINEYHMFMKDEGLSISVTDTFYDKYTPEPREVLVKKKEYLDSIMNEAIKSYFNPEEDNYCNKAKNAIKFFVDKVRPYLKF